MKEDQPLALNNDWLVSAVCNERRKRGSSSDIYDLVPYAVEARREIISNICSYEGTKIVVPFTSRFPEPAYIKNFEKVLKRALCLAQTVIVVPAPCFGYCTRWEPPNEFSWGTFIDGSSDEKIDGTTYRASMDLALIKALTITLKDNLKEVEKGSITFLPFLGTHINRWNHPDLGLPHLPTAISNRKDRDNPRKLLLQATYDLLSERLLAERLGAAHFNSQSFDCSALNDMKLLETPGGNFGHATLPIRMPIIDNLSLADLLVVRNEVSSAFIRFSRMVLQQRAPNGRVYLDYDTSQLEEDINNAITPLMDEVRELQQRSVFLAGKLMLKTTLFALGVAGELGSMSGALSFLAGGGTVWDLADMISIYKSFKLKCKQNSLFSIAARLAIE